MGRHATTLSTSAGTVARTRLRGAAPQVYPGQTQPVQPAFPLWFWLVLLTIATVLFVAAHL